MNQASLDRSRHIFGGSQLPNAQESINKRTPYPTPPGIEMSEVFPGAVKPIKENLIYQWTSNSRPFKQRKKQFYTTSATIIILLALILFFAGQILTVAVVLALAFMAYVFAVIPPNTINQQITTYGIRIGKVLYEWVELGRFWFDKKHNSSLLIVEVARFPNRLTMVLNSKDQEIEITNILSEILLHQKPELTKVEKASKWLEKKFPLEID